MKGALGSTVSQAFNSTVPFPTGFLRDTAGAHWGARLEWATESPVLRFMTIRPRPEVQWGEEGSLRRYWSPEAARGQEGSRRTKPLCPECGPGGRSVCRRGPGREAGSPAPPPPRAPQPPGPPLQWGALWPRSRGDLSPDRLAPLSSPQGASQEFQQRPRLRGGRRRARHAPVL